MNIEYIASCTAPYSNSSTLADCMRNQRSQCVSFFCCSRSRCL